MGIFGRVTPGSALAVVAVRLAEVSRRSWLRCGLALGSTVAVVAQSPTTLRSEGKRFVIECVRGSLSADLAQLLTDDALAAVEAFWPVLDKAIPGRSGDAPTIVLHVGAASFREIASTASRLPYLVGDFVIDDGSGGHVLCSPDAPTDVRLEAGLSPLTRERLLLTAARLVALQRSEVARQDPWLTEVVAHGLLEEAVSPRRVGGVDPLYDFRRHRLLPDVRAGTIPRLSTWLLDTAPRRNADQDAHERAYGAVVAEALAGANRTWVRKLLGKPTKRGSVTAHRVAAFESILGKDPAKLEQRWRACCEALAPVWWGKGSVGVRDAALYLMGGREESSYVGLTAELPESEYVVSARCRLAPAGVPQLRLELDWDQQTLVGVIVEPRAVVLSSWSAQGGWTDLQTVAADVRAEQPFELRVEVAGGLRVFVDGVELLHRAMERSWRGSWKVSVNHSVIWLEDLRLEALSADK